MNQKYKFMFSVVIPVYNVEKYLPETLDSVINQTIGFKENIQIILVNDGSPDDSEKICLEHLSEALTYRSFDRSFWTPVM